MQAPPIANQSGRGLCWTARARTRIPPVFLGLGFCLLMVWSGVAATLTALLDQDSIGVGESASLTLKFEGGSPASVPPIPAVDGLQFQYTGSSQNYTVVNGQASASLNLAYVVTPTRAGEFVIPAVRAPVGNTVLSSKPLKLKVLAANAPGGANPLDRLAFLRLIVPTNRVYVGELFPVEIQLFFQNAQDIQMPQIQAEGFTLGKKADPAQTQRRVGNAVYNVGIFKLTASAVRTGALTLGPVTENLNLVIPRRNARTGNLFDFFGPQADLRPVTLSSEPQSMQVLSLPAQNVPPGFNGAIGDFTMAVTAGPTNVMVGDPITVKVQLTGQGAWDALTLPAFSEWREFKTYPAMSKLETSDALGLEGVKTFECVVAPQNAEVKALPSVQFSFFNPRQGIYQTLARPPIPIAVRPASGPAPQPMVLGAPAPEKNSAPPTRDIVHIRNRLGPVMGMGPPWVVRTCYGIGLATPFFLWLAALAWRQQNDRWAHHPRLRRQRQVDRFVRAGLADLRRMAEANQKDEFFALMFRLLQEQLGERLDLPASAITEAVVDGHLRPRGLPEATLDRCRDLFQECNQARYARQHSAQGLGALAANLESVLRDLRKVPLPELPPAPMAAKPV
jgi:hypothetical protein